MDVQVLRWFQQVADGVTVTEVAEAELVSQPAVSRALARLEKEVGAPLLRREGRILRMTTAGAAFKGHVDAAIHHVDDGLAAVHQVLDPETGIVTVAYQPSLGPWLVPDLVSSFRAEHPGVEFDLRAKFHSPTPATGPGSDIDVELCVPQPRPRLGVAAHRERADAAARPAGPPARVRHRAGAACAGGGGAVRGAA